MSQAPHLTLEAGAVFATALGFRGVVTDLGEEKSEPQFCGLGFY